MPVPAAMPSSGSPRPRSWRPSAASGAASWCCRRAWPRRLRGWSARGVDKNGGTHGIERLSQRERQIFDLVIWGSSNKQIAGRLGISIKTVETHRGHINGKLRVHTSADIVRLASLWGLFLAGPNQTAAQEAGQAAMSVSNGTLPQ